MSVKSDFYWTMSEYCALRIVPSISEVSELSSTTILVFNDDSNQLKLDEHSKYDEITLARGCKLPVDADIFLGKLNHCTNAYVLFKPEIAYLSFPLSYVCCLEAFRKTSHKR